MSAEASTGGPGVAIGGIELASLTDAVGFLGELDELYPETPADAWEPYRALYPELHAGSKWRLPVTCFLVRTEERTVLVDAGVGPPGRWDWEAEWEGGLPAALAAVGVDPADVDTVLLTHLHVDHIGWLSDGGLFERARYVVHADALTFALEQTRVEWLRPQLRDLVDRGRIAVITEDTEVARGVTVAVLRGHYPGHVGLQLASGGARAVVIADAAVHPALLDRPDWLYVSDHEHATAASTRRELLVDLVDTGTLVACGHYPGSGIGRVARRDGRVVWAEAA